jgi:DNA invertase Pin-like site-specific DNA recombinase
MTPGWATYLRVSDEDKQTPERSFAMQRHHITTQLLEPSNEPMFREYTDLLSGKNPNRKDYQQMLTDAEAGKFNHLGLYRADRFGRNTVEGLQAATKLIGLGINIRIANMPGLQPENPDGFFLFLLQMGLAQREVDVLAQRTAGGMEAKMRAGGWPHKAPEGYINKERQISSNKYERWVEADAHFFQSIKDAWQMLLTDRYNLDDICEELNRRGYVRSSGRPWAWDHPKSSTRKTARNRLHEIFYNPFYAGWAVSERFDIKFGDVQGQWEPVVTTEQFERGKAILFRNGKNRSNFKRQDYLLRNMLYIKVWNRHYKMYGSTPTGRNQNYSYYITHAKPKNNIIRFETKSIDQQIPAWLADITINHALIPEIKNTYHSEIKKITQDNHEETLAQLIRRKSELQEEEVRIARLMVTESVGEEAYKQLRSEWQEKKVNVQCKIDDLQIDVSQYFDNLEVALALMTNISKLFERLEEKNKINLLQIIVKKIIINSDGEIIDQELHSPFSYLYSLTNFFRTIVRKGVVRNSSG